MVEKKDFKINLGRDFSPSLAILQALQSSSPPSHDSIAENKLAEMTLNTEYLEFERLGLGAKR